MRISVHLSPANATVTGPCAVIVDVLRATTTLTVALAHGARAVIPVGTPAEALALRAATPGTLACGERDGRIVPGFDLGNSPFEYTAERVGGRTLAFASTNGSLALIAARGAGRRVLGAFVNARTVVASVREERALAIVCAGKLGGFSLEDAACAGLLIARLEAHGGVPEGAAARLARTLAPRDQDEVRALVAGSAHARDLATMGDAYRRDLEMCAGLDTIERVFEV
ncbi:MAG TPA: 2-phosphosulfolactate phosphatase [Candidatus Eisenbacteria bacterium]|nr:2-phosphosulfolactate phosphatase [Candidatus Eisenbacteria bacterium]